VTDKKRYYALDEIGFVGTQKKQNASELKKDLNTMAQFVKAMKGKKVALNASKRK